MIQFFLTAVSRKNYTLKKFILKLFILDFLLVLIKAMNVIFTEFVIPYFLFNGQHFFLIKYLFLHYVYLLCLQEKFFFTFSEKFPSYFYSMLCHFSSFSRI
jgi:hypothetical protein